MNLIECWTRSWKFQNRASFLLPLVLYSTTCCFAADLKDSPSSPTALQGVISSLAKDYPDEFKYYGRKFWAVRNLCKDLGPDGKNIGSGFTTVGEIARHQQEMKMGPQFLNNNVKRLNADLAIKLQPDDCPAVVGYSMVQKLGYAALMAALDKLKNEIAQGDYQTCSQDIEALLDPRTFEVPKTKAQPSQTAKTIKIAKSGAK